MAEMEFCDESSPPVTEHAFIVRLANIDGKEALLEKIAAQLRFPDYYGCNWDAFEECLMDLSWIDEKEVFLVHDNLPSLEENDFRTYIQILSNSLSRWQSGDEHCFHVVFQRADESLIRSLLV